MDKTYHLFISHSWAYSDAYNGLIDLLDKDPAFVYTNYSVPKDDPIHTNGTDVELYAAIKEKIAHASVVLILSGVYSSYGKRCGFSKRYFLVLVACRHLTCTKTECRKMFLSLIAPLTTIRLNRGKRSNRLPYIFAQGQER